MILADAHNIPFRDSIFDLILLSEVLEHLSHVNSALQELKRISKNKGLIIISTPTLNTPLIRVELWLHGIIGRSGKWIEYHVKEYKLKELISLLRKHGLEPVLSDGVVFIYFPLLGKLLQIF